MFAFELFAESLEHDRSERPVLRQVDHQRVDAHVVTPFRQVGLRYVHQRLVEGPTVLLLARRGGNREVHLAPVLTPRPILR